MIPFLDERPNVRPLVEELRRVLDEIGAPVEAILVDDGSTDGTWDELRAVGAGWAAVRLVRFDRNRGQAAALWHGFQVARGRWVATLDGDGQNPPAELARLWRVRHAADFVAGVRVARHDSRLRRVMSRVANAVRRRVLGDAVRDSGCALRLFRREIVPAIAPIRTLYSFLPAFAAAGGWRVVEVPVAHRARRAGASKYGLRVMAVRPLVDMVVLWWVLRGGRSGGVAGRALACDARS